jgi:hypothetical protein
MDRIEQLEQALRFYAKRKNYSRGETIEGYETPSIIELDGGLVADKALNTKVKQFCECENCTCPEQFCQECGFLIDVFI